MASEPIYRFNVTADRLAKAQKVLADVHNRITNEQFMEVVIELVLYDGVTFENNKVKINLTELQQCALAAGLGAAIEGGCKQVLSDKYHDPSSDILTILN